MTMPDKPAQNPPASRSLRTWSFALLVAALMALVLMPSGSAEVTSNHGTIKVHDEEVTDPVQRNVPHVDCVDFWIQGFNMADGSGTLVFYAWPPTGDKSVVLTANWTATSHDHEGAGGFGFMAGPFTLDAGHYHVEAFLAGGHVGGNEDHKTKSKTFWVEPCEPTPPEELVCPPDLAATANADGSITLTFTAAAGSDGTNVYRTDVDGHTDHLATLDGSVGTYTDLTAEAGAAYTYSVTALYGNEESEECPIVEVTVIPDLGTPIALAAAGVLGLGAYVMLRRRK